MSIEMFEAGEIAMCKFCTCLPALALQFDDFSRHLCFPLNAYIISFQQEPQN